MEILERWRALGRVRWALVVAPLAAALVAGGLAARQPAEHLVVSTVAVPLADAGISPPGVRQAVANYQSALLSHSLMEHAAEVTGEPLGRLRRHLRLTQVAAGNVAHVSYRAADPLAAAEVTRVAATLALHEYLSPMVVEAQSLTEVVAAEVAQTRAALDAFPGDPAADPDEAVRARQQQGLAESLAGAESRLAEAQQRQATVEARLALADDPRAVTVGSPERISPLPAVLEAAVSAAVISLLVIGGALAFAWVMLRLDGSRWGGGPPPAHGGPHLNGESAGLGSMHVPTRI